MTDYGRCDAWIVGAHARCRREGVRVLAFECGCGHYIMGAYCAACATARVAGCLRCWDDFRHRCVLHDARVRA